MSVSAEALTAALPDIAFQEASLDIWDKKYRLKSKTGEIIDQEMDDTYKRVARALAAVEATPEAQQLWYREFLWALRRGAIPAGRITSNAGALDHKPATSTINCTVSGTIGDSMNDILGKVHEAGLTLKAGCGIGYEFSTLRPKGAYVSGCRRLHLRPAVVHGHLRQDVFHRVLGRRPARAQMATFDISHPDVMDFIRAKRENGVLRQFNCSLLITDDFIRAVRDDTDWQLVFPVLASEADEIDLHDPSQVLWREWPNHNGYVVNEEGLVACKIYKTVPARRLWNMIMTSTYDFAEPGFVLVDRINEQNNNWWCENIRATNPCGEQPLPPYGACLLGSVNLTRFVEDPFTENAHFNWDEYRRTVRIFTRMLDNVVEINGLPLDKQRKEIEYKRRHGMGFLGLGSALTMLRMHYGQPDKSLQFTEQVAREMAVAGWEVGLELAEEKGPAPIMLDEFEVTAAMLRQRPEMKRDGYKVGDKVPGRILHARYSRYMQKVAEVAPELVDKLAEHGARFTHHTSIAPTGTISLSLANNASNGIEPSFRPSLQPQRDSRRPQEQGKGQRLLLRAAGLPHPGQPGRNAVIPRTPRTAAGLFHHGRDGHAARACRYPGRGPEVDRLVDLQDRQCADRLPVRGLQGHLPVCLGAGPERLHHLPLQPAGLPGCAGDRQGPRVHDLRVRTRRRFHRRAQGQRGSRVRR
jgi:ribonucleoside-diphosphate reductase alpha chain